MIEITDRPRNVEKQQLARPRFHFSGLIGKPGEFTQGGEKLHATALFNAGLTTIERTKPDGQKEKIPIAIARFMDTSYQNNNPDWTKKFILYSFLPGTESIRNMQVIDPSVFLSPEQLHHTNIEDFRLTYLAEKNLVVSSFTTVSDESLPLVPRITLAIARPTCSESGNVSLEFQEMHIVKDTNGNPINGKNCIVLDTPDKPDELTILYRPEFLPNAPGIVNGNYFQFAKVPLQENGAIHADTATITEEGMAIPFYDRVKRYGWNGGNGSNGIPVGDGEYLDVIHFIEKDATLPDGGPLDDEYGFLLGRFAKREDGGVACKGIYTEPFFTYEDQQKLLQVKGESAVKFNLHKNVIYSNGSMLDGDELVMSVSTDDSSFGFVRVPVQDVIAFAAATEFLPSNEDGPQAIQRRSV